MKDYIGFTIIEILSCAVIGALLATLIHFAWLT